MHPVLLSVVDLVAPKRCPACDLALAAGEVDFCDGCEVLFERLPYGPAAYEYAGPLADAIRRVKYGGRGEHVDALGRLLVGAAACHAGHVDAVVPVPSHPRRIRERGFDPVALLARPVARALGVPFRPSRVRRVRPTPPQAGRDVRGRIDNVRGAFRAKPDPRHPRLLVIDDVRTTGATLGAVADALRQAGAIEIRVLALAGVPFVE